MDMQKDTREAHRKHGKDDRPTVEVAKRNFNSDQIY